jgi:3-oxoacyl-[acyl-carrier-protein] synthase-3
MLYLHGIGHFHPETVIDNRFLANLDIGVDEEWILQRVGIRERRTVLDLEYIRATHNVDVRAAEEASRYSNAQTGCRAAQMALSRANLQRSDIGMVVAGGCSPQNLIPADACTIAAQLGIDAPSFDINSACSSFAVQMWLMSGFSTADADFILVVNPENNTRVTNYDDRSTAVLWGDASTAVVVSTHVPSPVSIACSTPGSAPAEWAKIKTPNGCHFSQDGHAVQAFAIRTMCALLGGLRRPDGSGGEYFIGHQANKLALESVRKRLEIPEDRHLFNVDRFGNCGAAGAPSVLSQNWEKCVAGQSVLMAMVGSGLTWGALRFDFRDGFASEGLQKEV